jgi:phage baseplate assembly protein W
MAKSPVYELAISLPFKISDFGGISTTISQEKIWADRVRSAIGTLAAERVFRLDYGTTIPEELFNNTEEMTATIESEVENVFIEYLPTLQFDSVEVTFDKLQDTIFAEIGYFLPNKDQTSVTIGIARLSTNNPIEEELL